MSIVADRILNDFFSGRQHSFRECYIALTGDRKVTGRLADCDVIMMREAMGATNLPNILADAMNRRMLAEYNRGGIYDVWRKVAAVGKVSDFRPQHRVRWGGFGDLPAVAEGADYLDGASPTDESVSFAASKRGRLVTITMEAIKNDDVEFIRRLPVKLAQAAKRTLARFVMNMIKNNPVIFDGQPLFSVVHENLGAAPLSAVSLSAGINAIQKQKEFGGDDPMSARGRYLLVPMALEEFAHDLLFNRGPNQDKSFLQTRGTEVVPVWDWEDANDWALIVSPDEYPTIELGFMDGHEEPELIVEENPSVGSLFANDCLTWKIRHIYGGAVIDYRGMYKSVVA